MPSCLPAGRLFQAISEQLDGKNKTLVDLYNEIDEDQNGKLSFNELCLLLISLDVSVPEAQVRSFVPFLLKLLVGQVLLVATRWKCVCFVGQCVTVSWAGDVCRRSLAWCRCRRR